MWLRGAVHGDKTSKKIGDATQARYGLEDDPKPTQKAEVHAAGDTFVTDLYDYTFSLRIITFKQQFGVDDMLLGADLDTDFDFFKERDGHEVAKDSTNTHGDQGEFVRRAYFLCQLNFFHRYAYSRF